MTNSVISATNYEDQLRHATPLRQAPTSSDSVGDSRRQQISGGRAQFSCRGFINRVLFAGNKRAPL